MATTVATAGRPLVAGEALEPFRRVKINTSNEYVYADADHAGVGVTPRNFDNGSNATAERYSLEGTLKVEAAGAIALNGLCYAAADGKVSATANGKPVFIALEAATADGDIIEVEPIVLQSQIMMAGTLTVSAGQAAANSNNGQVDIVTGWGTTSLVAIVEVFDSSGSIENSGYAITYPGSADAGTVRISGIGSGLQLDAGDIVNYIIFRV